MLTWVLNRLGQYRLSGLLPGFQRAADRFRTNAAGPYALPSVLYALQRTRTVTCTAVRVNGSYMAQALHGPTAAESARDLKDTRKIETFCNGRE